MLGKIRSLVYASTSVDPMEESSLDRTSLLNALVVDNLENSICGNHMEALDSTQFLMQKIENNQNEI